jgi:maltooligosyltrehalose trehalohydrolase
MDTFNRSKLQWQLLNEDPHRTMLEYYRSLIRLRRSQPALNCLQRKQLHVEADVPNKVLSLHRWTDEQHIVCFMNFSDRKQFLVPPSFVKQWQLLFDSASPQWKGPQSSPEKISGGEPGAPMLTLQPESVVVYGNQIQ